MGAVKDFMLTQLNKFRAWRAAEDKKEKPKPSSSGAALDTANKLRARKKKLQAALNVDNPDVSIR